MKQIYYKKKISFHLNKYYQSNQVDKNSAINLFTQQKRGKDRNPYEFQINDNIYGFTLKDIKYFQDFDITAYYLKHNSTNCHYLHLDSPDQHNVFAIILKSLAPNQKGLNKIFKSMLNNGSQKYPIKESLNLLNKYSLNKYIDGMDNEDHTQFSFISNNYKDYLNLMDVYCDLIFKPIFSETDFLENAWRYEFKEKDCEQSELLYKGKVYQEIKKQIKNPQKIFKDTIKDQIYSGSRHGESSQVMPSTILKTSFDQIRENYLQQFDFGNCYYYTYGDFNFAYNLQYLNERYLKQNQNDFKIYQSSNISDNRLTFPKRVIQLIPTEDSDIPPSNQFKFAISFLCNERHQDPILSISFIILNYIFFHQKDSPFYKNLIEKGIGSQLAQNNGYDMNNQETSFTIGIENIKKNQIKLVEQIINETFLQMSIHGINPIIIEKSLNSIEYDFKKSCQNFSQNLMQKVIGDFLNDNLDFEFLNVKENMKEIRQLIKSDKKYFQKIIRKYFIDNINQIQVICEPDVYYNQLMKINEKRQLQLIKNHLDDYQTQQIIEQQKQIQQNKIDIQQDSTILPKLSQFDIVNDNYQFQYKTKLISDILVVSLNENTKGITNLIFKFEFSQIPQSLREYFNIFQQFFQHIGVKNHSFETFRDIKQSYSQEFKCSHKVIDNGKIKDLFILKTSCLDQFIENQFFLIENLFKYPDFENYEIIQMLLNLTSDDKAQEFLENSLDYGISYSSSSFNQAINLNDKVHFARFISKEGKDAMNSENFQFILKTISQKLIEIFNFIIKSGKMSISIHSNMVNQPLIYKKIESFIDQLKIIYPNFQKHEEDKQETLPLFNESYLKSFFLLPKQLQKKNNQNSNLFIESFKVPNINHEQSAVFQLISQLISDIFKKVEKVESNKISGSIYNNNGALSIYCSDDSYSFKSLEYCENAIQEIKDGKFSEDQLLQAKISFYKNDFVKQTKDIFYEYFIYDMNFDKKKEFQIKIMSVTKQQIMQVASEFLYKSIEKGEFSQVIIGQTNDQKTLQQKGWKIEEPVEIKLIQDQNIQIIENALEQILLDQKYII